MTETEAEATTRTPSPKEFEVLLFSLMRRLRAHMEVCAQGEGLTFQQAVALRRLEDAAPMRDLAETLHCDASYVTGLADSLEARGLIARQPDPGDRRVKQLVLTSEGQRVREGLEARLSEGHPLTQGLSEEERRTLHNLLWTLVSSNQ